VTEVTTISAVLCCAMRSDEMRWDGKMGTEGKAKGNGDGRVVINLLPMYYVWMFQPEQDGELGRGHWGHGRRGNNSSYITSDSKAIR